MNSRRGRLLLQASSLDLGASVVWTPLKLTLARAMPGKRLHWHSPTLASLLAEVDKATGSDLRAPSSGKWGLCGGDSTRKPFAGCMPHGGLQSPALPEDSKLALHVKHKRT